MVWVHMLKSRYMLEYTLFNMPLISVYAPTPPAIFFFLIKNGMQSVWQCSLWCTVIWSP